MSHCRDELPAENCSSLCSGAVVGQNLCLFPVLLLCIHSLPLSQPLGLLLPSSLPVPVSNKYPSKEPVFTLYHHVINSLVSSLRSSGPWQGRWYVIPTQITIPQSSQGAAAASIATSSNCGMDQDEVTGITMKLNRGPVSGICMATVSFIFTKASCRKLLPVFPAMLRSAVDDVPALLRGCLLGSAISPVLCPP